MALFDLGAGVFENKMHDADWDLTVDVGHVRRAALLVGLVQGCAGTHPRVAASLERSSGPPPPPLLAPKGIAGAAPLPPPPSQEAPPSWHWSQLDMGALRCEPAILDDEAASIATVLPDEHVSQEEATHAMEAAMEESQRAEALQSQGGGAAPGEATESAQTAAAPTIASAPCHRCEPGRATPQRPGATARGGSCSCCASARPSTLHMQRSRPPPSRLASKEIFARVRFPSSEGKLGPVMAGPAPELLTQAGF